MTALDPDTGRRTEPTDTASPPAGRPTIDLTRTEALLATTRTTTPGHDGDDTDAHLLRLCLDLQLDALLLSLGAVATQRVRDDESWVPGSAPPWRRWVEEDVDLAASLAADALAGGATLPSTLGNEGEHRMPSTVMDNLAARYESMTELLADLLVRDVPGAEGWRPHVRDALHRCTLRLSELRAHRAPQSPPTGVPVGTSSARPAREHEYLPGELLG